MNTIQKLKAELGGGYSFERLYGDGEIRRIQKTNPSDFPETTVATLTVGCLRIDAVLYRAGGRLLLGYDVFVKDDPDSEEWICYDNPTDPVSLKEQDMLDVLDRIASENGLSYTESNFETLDGKEISVKEKPPTMSL